MAIEEKQKRRSRFSTDYYYDEDGKPVIVTSRELTDVSVKALQFLAIHRTGSYELIAAGVGAHPKTIIDLFKILRAKGNEYVRIVSEQATNPKKYLTSNLYFELAPAGVSAVKERGQVVTERRPLKRLRHQVMEDEISASWRMGIEADTKVTAVWWDEVKNRMPESTQSQKHPSQVKVTFTFKNQRVTHPYMADGRPFVIRHPAGAYCFPGFEADCDSESIRSDSHTYSSITRKLLQQIAIIEQGLYRSHFGFPNIFFLYYVPTRHRMESIMELLEELTEKKPTLRKCFGFAIHPTISNVDYDKMQPSAWAFTEDYLRVGYEPLNFSK